MSAIFEAIPGIEVPVGSISTGLAKMWEYAASEGRSAPDGEHAKAIQVNLVLHLGFGTDAEDAVEPVRDDGEVLAAVSEPGRRPLPPSRRHGG